ncbi:MAG: hypothetical protein K6357_03600 [Elusimicrobiota bacterium]
MSFIKKLAEKLPFLILAKAAPKIIDTINKKINPDSLEKEDFYSLEKLIIEEAKLISKISAEVDLIRQDLEFQKKVFYFLITTDIIILIFVVSITIKLF